MTAAPPPRRFRSFTVNGRPVHLVEDPAVRARDLERCMATVVMEDTGEVLEVLPRHLHEPPLPGLPPPGPLYELRPLFEELLGLGFTDTWLTEFMNACGRLRLFRECDG